MDSDPRRMVARLAAALIIADDRISAGERQAALAFDEIGLGEISPLIEEEIEHAVHHPIDIAAACTPLTQFGPHAATVIVAMLTELAASDRELAPQELRLLHEVGGRLGIVEEALTPIINTVLRQANPAVSPVRSSTEEQAPPPPSPVATASPRAGAHAADLAQAYGLLGIAPGADRATVEAAYLDVIGRYNPAKLAELGADFVALAVRRLAKATAAYDIIRGASHAPARAESGDPPSVVHPAQPRLSTPT